MDDGDLSVEEEESTDFVMWIDVAARLVVWGIIRLWEESRCVYHLQLLCMFIVGKMREILDWDCERRTMHYLNLKNMLPLHCTPLPNNCSFIYFSFQFTYTPLTSIDLIDNRLLSSGNFLLSLLVSENCTMIPLLLLAEYI